MQLEFNLEADTETDLQTGATLVACRNHVEVKDSKHNQEYKHHQVPPGDFPKIIPNNVILLNGYPSKMFSLM